MSDIGSIGSPAKVSARNKNSLLPKGTMRCWSSNKRRGGIMKGSRDEVKAVDNKTNFLDRYQYGGTMRLSSYWRDDDGFAPPTFLSAEGEKVFREWLKIEGAAVMPPGLPARRPPDVAPGLDAAEKRVAKRMLSLLTPDTKRRAMETLGVSP